MKRNQIFLLPALMAVVGILSLTSCGDIQQEIYIHQDGSGKMEVSYELGEMMSMMSGFGDMGVSDDTLSDDEMPLDTADVMSSEENQGPMDNIMKKVTDPNYTLAFDTLFSFADIMPDSVKDKEHRLDLLSKLSIHMKSPANSADLTIGIVISYDSKQQLQDIINHLDTLEQKDGVLPGAASGGLSKESFTHYEADLKAGWIRIDSMDYSSYNDESGMAGDSSATSGEDQSMLDMLFGNSKIRTIIHVPGEVISCTNSEAIITKDDRVIVEQDFIDAVKKGKVPGYTIKFKPGK